MLTVTFEENMTPVIAHRTLPSPVVENLKGVLDLTTAVLSGEQVEHCSGPLFSRLKFLPV
jgi:hypothetical protein